MHKREQHNSNVIRKMITAAAYSSTSELITKNSVLYAVSHSSLQAPSYRRLICSCLIGKDLIFREV